MAVVADKESYRSSASFCGRWSTPKYLNSGVPLGLVPGCIMVLFRGGGHAVDWGFAFEG